MFEFKCGDCGEVYDQIIRGDDIPICKHCGSTDNQEKQLTSASFTFVEPKITDISQVPKPNFRH